MLDGCTRWPADIEQRYRAAGYREGLTPWAMVARTAAGRVYSRVLQNSMLKNNGRIKALTVSLIIEWE
jgi:non-ribosomal peptide synthetase component E (peptide arylation enzyme)